ncbi:MAG TPA: FAD-linked oxidase C-terminal domain-containing protein [Bacteroidales bacterium]|nr:FAD-linked oxidase C-terminal domain-containing protein [Bacteroidales bacterium]HPS51517.1 FAD-linked oxidase C-terminal domain-containing protein [Bacteroidales bacterium]
MNKDNFQDQIEKLRVGFEGEIFVDEASRILYATDASAYREKPLGVARPRHTADISRLIAFARETGTPLIPRTAGTSLAGQVVGNGLVVDVSRYMTAILEFNAEERWVRVQPGVILDELNAFASRHGLFFGPETSTSSRCMMGGMVGNNSCGAHSILYGSTRDHVISVKGFLSDGSEVEFRDLTSEEFQEKCSGETLENKIYRQILEILSDPVNQEEIRKEYPDPRIHRRNTGYALDLLLGMEPFFQEMQNAKCKMQNADSGMRHWPLGIREKQSGNQSVDQSINQSISHSVIQSFNLAKLISGSEGTLMFMTEIKLNLVPLPPKEKALICVHCRTVEESLEANLLALKYSPGSVELMDKPIMDCTKDNITQRQNRFFIEDDPGAILIIEFARETRDEIMTIYHDLVEEMKSQGLGYHYPIVFPPDLKKVWDLRKAGLGVLSNYPGDRKPVPVIEDTAVHPENLPAYIDEFNKMMAGLGLACVYYAHIGSGELHLRPVLNLKDPGDVELFHTVAFETAKIVKKFRGSLSGEHGDGRLRGEFIPFMLGEHNYGLFREIKSLWDPHHIFNPGKITDTPKMNTSLRFEPGKTAREIATVFDFSHNHGILRAAEQCNGSGDCRNTVITGRWMCPSYMAAKEENTTTRARANILREFLTNSSKENPFDHKEIYEVMDLCLSCKACKAECPSNVDIAKLKAEFLQHYYDANGIPLRSRLIANITSINKLGSIVPGLFNFFQKNRFFSGIIKNTLGFAQKRDIPLLYSTTLRAWTARHDKELNKRNMEVKATFQENAGTGAEPESSKLDLTVYLFADEFTNFNDVEIGIKAIKLMNALGYRVIIPDHEESGRTFLSKGLIRKAKKLANANVSKLKDLITADTPLIGIEPSAILTFRDEYPDLVDPELKEAALNLAKHAVMFDEFVVNELQNAKCKMQIANIKFKDHSLNQSFSQSVNQSVNQSINHSVNQSINQFFTEKPLRILLHGHCHQKALASVETTKKMLSIPVNYEVEEIKSGCCGMAGSFGYEKEHYSLSMKVGELVLFPAVRKATEEMVIVAPGTSCRHQIKDGTGRRAFHPIEVLYDALLEKV